MSHQLINRDHLQTCSGGDLAFEQELLALYVTDAREQLAVIEAAMATGDWGTVQRAAHQLKGTSSNLGIDRMHSAASQLEQAVQQMEYATLASLWTELETTYAAVVVQVETWN